MKKACIFRSLVFLNPTDCFWGLEEFHRLGSVAVGCYSQAYLEQGIAGQVLAVIGGWLIDCLQNANQSSQLSIIHGISQKCALGFGTLETLEAPEMASGGFRVSRAPNPTCMFL
jgi:hypothetical protein